MSKINENFLYFVYLRNQNIYIRNPLILDMACNFLKVKGEESILKSNKLRCIRKLLARLSQSLWTTTPKNFYHPNQLMRSLEF